MQMGYGITDFSIYKEVAHSPSQMRTICLSWYIVNDNVGTEEPNFDPSAQVCSLKLHRNMLCG